MATIHRPDFGPRAFEQTKPKVGLGIEVLIVDADNTIYARILAFKKGFMMNGPYGSLELEPFLDEDDRLELNVPHGMRMVTRPLLKELPTIIHQNWDMGPLPILREYIWRIQDVYRDRYPRGAWEYFKEETLGRAKSAVVKPFRIQD